MLFYIDTHLQDQSKFLADMTFVGKTDSADKTTKQDFYQGVNVVSGMTPPSGTDFTYELSVLLIYEFNILNMKLKDIL